MKQGVTEGRMPRISLQNSHLTQLHQGNIEEKAITQVTAADSEDVLHALKVWSEAPEPPMPKNVRSARTRQYLLDAATRSFVQTGYADCTVEDILKESNVSRGTFYSHFKSKKAIFAAMISLSIESRLSVTNVSRESIPLVQDRVRESVRKYLGLFYHPMDLSHVIEQAAYHDSTFRPIRMLIRESFVRRITRGILGQQRRGVADPAVDAEEAGRAIVSMLTYFALTEVGWRDRPPTEEMVETLAQFWMRGIQLQPE